MADSQDEHPIFALGASPGDQGPDRGDRDVEGVVDTAEVKPGPPVRAERGIRRAVWQEATTTTSARLSVVYPTAVTRRSSSIPTAVATAPSGKAVTMPSPPNNGSSAPGFAAAGAAGAEYGGQEQGNEEATH